VVVRAGFSSRELYEHVYKPKFGHCMLPTVTAQYRKILSDHALHGKLKAFGDAVRARSGPQRFLKQHPLTVRIEIDGFQPCDLVLTQDCASCGASGAGRPDVKVKMPYMLLAAARMTRTGALLTALRALLSGQVRTAGLARLMVRQLALIIHGR
jgi:hypothetical protein